MLEAAADAVGDEVDKLFSPLGLRFANGGRGAELVCGIFGIIIVLVAGSIWRKRAQQKHAEHAAEAA